MGDKRKEYFCRKKTPYNRSPSKRTLERRLAECTARGRGERPVAPGPGCTQGAQLGQGVIFARKELTSRCPLGVLLSSIFISELKKSTGEESVKKQRRFSESWMYNRIHIMNITLRPRFVRVIWAKPRVAFTEGVLLRNDFVSGGNYFLNRIFMVIYDISWEPKYIDFPKKTHCILHRGQYVWRGFAWSRKCLLIIHPTLIVDIHLKFPFRFQTILWYFCIIETNRVA